MSEPLSPYVDIAAYLKDVRTMRSVTTQQLAQAVHIRERYILALEAGQIELLPGSAYARGYIERILEFLEVDAKALLEEFDAVTESPSRKLFHLNMHWGHSPHPSAQFALICLAVALLFLVMWQSVRHENNASLIDAFTPQEVQNNAKPSRCTQESEWPCYWEKLEYWYTERVKKEWK